MYQDSFTALPKRKLGDTDIPPIGNPIGGGWVNHTGTSNVPLAAQRMGSPSRNPQQDGPPPRPTGAPAYMGGPAGTSTYGPGNTLINQQFNPTASDRLNKSRGMADDAASAYAGGGMPQYRALGPINTGGYSETFGQAAGMAGQMQLPSFSPLGGTNYGATRTLLGQANVDPSSALQGMAGPGQTGSFGFSGDTTGVRGRAVAQLDRVLDDSTDRAKLGADAYQLMLERAAPGEGMEDRRLAQRTAALGRTRSGMFNSEQMDLATSRERTRDQARREIAMNAAQQALADRMTKLGAAQGLSSDMASQDLGAGNLNLGYQNSNNAERGDAFRRMSSMEGDRFNRALSLADREAGMAERTRGDLADDRDSGLRFGEARNRMLGEQADRIRRGAQDQYGLDVGNYGRAFDERGVEMDVEQRGEDRRRSRLGDLSAYSRGIEGSERADRDELRGERDFQYGVNRDQVGDDVRQWEMEQDAMDRRFRRGQGRYSLGQGSDPYGAMRDTAGDYGTRAESGYGAAADVLGNASYRRRILGGETGRPPAAAGPAVQPWEEMDPDSYLSARRRRA